MGLLARASTVVTPARMRGYSGSDPFDSVYQQGPYVPPGWIAQISTAGVRVTPDLAMTLSAVYCAVTTISDDIATMPCHIYKYLGDDGDKARVRNHPLSYLLRWQPNQWQTAKEFLQTMVGHVLLRNFAFAEIVPGPRSAIGQLIPRHPDRVRQLRLPNGSVKYHLLGVFNEDGSPRYLTADEVFVLRDLTTDGLTGMSRTAYGARALGVAIAQETHTGTYFKQGATPAIAAIHKGGELQKDEEEALHASISRYIGGAEHAGGILVIEDDVDIKNIGVDPKNAELLGLKDYSVREVARLFKMPAHKLEASQQTQAYAAREQANLEYMMGCLRPIVVGIEQAIMRDLIIERDEYFAEFLMEALLRGDLKSRSLYFQKAIASRWMWPSEVRRREGMNRDEELDELSKLDHRTGSTRDSAAGGGTGEARHVNGGHSARATLMAYDNAVRVLRRERAAVEKIAKKHPSASDVDTWHTELRTFFESHAGFVAETMRLPIGTARAYAAQHGAELEARGLVFLDEHWERCEAEDLVELSLDPDRAGGLAVATA